VAALRQPAASVIETILREHADAIAVFVEDPGAACLEIY